MIDKRHPDFANTPASDQRPDPHYAPVAVGAPLVSIITPYLNTGPVFAETITSVLRQTLARWEWILVDDGTTDAASLAQLDALLAAEPRARVLRQDHGGPSVARNLAAKEARGEYLAQLDSDDLIEATFLEKAIWFLARHPQFAACGARTVTFGEEAFLWDRGFEQTRAFLAENWVTNMAVIRLAAFLRCGGYDTSLQHGHEDWDFWLNLASAGEWGYTLPEYLTWYRRQPHSRLRATEAHAANSMAFRAWIRKKHAGLARRFPRPVLARGGEFAATDAPPRAISNPLTKPDGATRLLLVVPTLARQGDALSEPLARGLGSHGRQWTVVATRREPPAGWGPYAAHTSDIFQLDRFLDYADYPAFLDYLIGSRQIDAALILDEGIGLAVAPYLRARHPHLPILDLTPMRASRQPIEALVMEPAAEGSAFDLRIAPTARLSAAATRDDAPMRRESPTSAASAIVDEALLTAQRHAAGRPATSVLSTEESGRINAMLLRAAREDTRLRERERLAARLALRMRVWLAPIGSRRYRVYSTSRHAIARARRGAQRK